MTAPEPYLGACLHVLYVATIYARGLAWRSRRSLRVRWSKEASIQLADLMDAVHNLPHLIQAWETCDEARIRADLAAYDEKWGERGPVRLLPEYEQAVSGQLQQPSGRQP